MKFATVALSLCLSTAALARPYELVTIANDEVDSHLKIGTDATHTPENLQGLWWLDGNPLADEVISFAGTTWTNVVENGEVVGHEAQIPVYDEGIWTWHDSVPGHALYAAVLKFKLVYHLSFNSDFTFGSITPVIKPSAILPSKEFQTSVLIDFTMTQLEPNEWRRDSKLLGTKSSYRFRRIVDAQGNRLPAFDEYLRKAEVPTSFIPVCKKDFSGAVPSACSK